MPSKAKAPRKRRRPKLPLTAKGKKTKAQEMFDQMIRLVDDEKVAANLRLNLAGFLLL